MADSRFVIAVHVLTALAVEKRTLKSGRIAASVNTNPVVIRRITRQLAKAGLLRSVSGAAGGSQLACAAAGLTLRQIYEAIGGGEIFAFHPKSPNAACPIGAHIQSVLQPVLLSAGGCVANELSKTTLADIVAGVHHKHAQACNSETKPTSPAFKPRGTTRSKS